jgi:hypothetical protein
MIAALLRHSTSALLGRFDIECHINRSTALREYERPLSLSCSIESLWHDPSDISRILHNDNSSFSIRRGVRYMSAPLTHCCVIAGLLLSKHALAISHLEN